MDPEHRLEGIEGILEELDLMPDSTVILVEGINDKKALTALGIRKRMIAVQSEGGPLRASEKVYEMKADVVIMTDWDDKGETIKDELKRNLSSLSVRYDTNLRSKLGELCVKDIKDIESLPILHRRLTSETRKGRI